MKRNLAFASLAILGALAATPTILRAQAPTDLAHMPPAAGNVIGGGGASLSGGGDDGTITYSGGGAGGGARYEQAGRSVTFAGNNGDNPVWTYGPAPASDPGRIAWVVGGSEDLQVIYVSLTGSPRR
jgi:hypothetical protein